MSSHYKRKKVTSSSTTNKRESKYQTEASHSRKNSSAGSKNNHKVLNDPPKFSSTAMNLPKLSKLPPPSSQPRSSLRVKAIKAATDMESIPSARVIPDEHHLFSSGGA